MAPPLQQLLAHLVHPIRVLRLLLPPLKRCRQLASRPVPHHLPHHPAPLLPCLHALQPLLPRCRKRPVPPTPQRPRDKRPPPKLPRVCVPPALKRHKRRAVLHAVQHARHHALHVAVMTLLQLVALLLNHLLCTREFPCDCISGPSCDILSGRLKELLQLAHLVLHCCQALLSCLVEKRLRDALTPMVHRQTPQIQGLAHPAVTHAPNCTLHHAPLPLCFLRRCLPCPERPPLQLVCPEKHNTLSHTPVLQRLVYHLSVPAPCRRP